MNITKKIKPFKPSISQRYHEATKIVTRAKEIPAEEWPESWKTVNFKGYPRFTAIKLPEPAIPDKVAFKEVLYKRQSLRDFSKNKVTLKDISNVLYYSAGIREENETWTGNRFYPSAGARYPIEVYPIILGAESVKPGVYHYYLKKHLLELLPEKQNYKQLSIEYFGNPWAKDASVFLVISAVFYRNMVKYGERGYRHVLTELGCLMQNIYLSCAVLNLGCCPTGGYNDGGYNSLLDLDGAEESVIGVIAIGKK